MNTVKDLKDKLGLTQLTDATALDHEVTDGYVCDLLSWVMARGEHGVAWITVQTHLNIVAVASLHDFSCVIVPEDIEVPIPTLEKANEEGIIIFSSNKTAYQLSCLMCSLGIGK